MNTLQKTLLAVIAGSVVSVSAQAALFSNAGYAGQPYVGVKAGKFRIDADKLDDPTAYGAYAGYNFTPAVGMEIEYVGSSEESISGNGINLDYDLKTYGIYGTYRYAFPNTALYAKGKLGFAKAELNVDASGFGVSDSDSSDDTGIAGGIGLGYNFTPNAAIEAEYAIVAEDIDLLTIGANYKF